MSSYQKKIDSKWSVSALLISITASLCCTLPILATFLGFSLFAGASAFFESTRPYLLTGTFIFLGIAYFQIFKKPTQEELECECDEDTLRKNKYMKYLLHVITVATLFFAFFPQIISTNNNSLVSKTSFEKVAFIDIEGMTCEGCSIGVQQAVMKIDGVLKADVSYMSKLAIVYFDNTKKVNDDDIKTAIESVGFKIKKLEWRGE